MAVRGKAFVFGKNIDTDQIYPGRFVEYTDVEEVKKYAMYGADEDFVKKFQPGDIIVAGTNFGCGSSREHPESGGGGGDFSRILRSDFLSQRHQFRRTGHQLPGYYPHRQRRG